MVKVFKWCFLFFRWVNGYWMMWKGGGKVGNEGVFYKGYYLWILELNK